MKGFLLSFSLISIVVFSNCKKNEASEPISKGKSWKFAVVGDTHVTDNSDTVKEMIPYIINDSVDLVVVCGDIVEGGLRTTTAQMSEELQLWKSIFKPIYDKGIAVYTMRGNHENDVVNNLTAWNSMFSGLKEMPQNGPSDEINLTYSFEHKNAKFIILDDYINIHRVNQTWLDQQLDTNTKPHVFVFGHEAAFKVFHTDCLDDYSNERNQFWQSMANAGVRAYFCGHDHFFDATQIDDGDSNSENNIYQLVVGGGGGWIMSKYNYNGTNSTYTPVPKYHRNAHGYALVQVSGESSSVFEVTITCKERYEDGSNKTVSYISTDNIIHYTISAK